MFKDEYVFSQLVKFLDYEKFKYIVKKYNGNKYIKSYTCWNQQFTMTFGQLFTLQRLICACQCLSGLDFANIKVE